MLSRKILFLRKIEKIRWIESVIHWAEFFLLLAVCNTTVSVTQKISAGDDLLFIVYAEIVKHGWLLAVLFVTRSSKSILKIRRETLLQILKWIDEDSTTLK